MEQKKILMKISVELIKKVRELTGAPVIRVKKVLEEFKGDEKKAIDLLKKEGFEKVAKREGRETSQGLVEVYSHHSGKVASLVELLCETDFVSRNDLFKALAHDLALQVASIEVKDAGELLKQDFIKKEPGIYTLESDSIYLVIKSFIKSARLIFFTMPSLIIF